MTGVTPVIIWDIDDVWHPWYAIAHRASIDFGLTTEDAPMPTTWAPHEHYGCTLEQWVTALDAWTVSGELHASTPTDEDLGVFASLWIMGADHHFVTARGFMGQHAELIRALTREWVDKHFHGYYYSLDFRRDKGARAKELRATHAIDDNYGNWLDLTEAGVRTFLRNQTWNEDADVPDHLRVNSIAEFGAAIEKEIANS